MDDDSPLAKLDFLIQEERERFRLAEERIKTYDAEATGALTTGVAFGALIVAGFSDTEVSTLATWTLALGGVLLVAAVFIGILSRRTPEPLARIGKYKKGEVAEYDAATQVVEDAEEAANRLTAQDPAQELRQRSLDLWRARTVRAQLVADKKERTVRFSLIALYFAVAALALVAVFQFFPPFREYEEFL